MSKPLFAPGVLEEYASRRGKKKRKLNTVKITIPSVFMEVGRPEKVHQSEAVELRELPYMHGDLFFGDDVHG